MPQVKFRKENDICKDHIKDRIFVGMPSQEEMHEVQAIGLLYVAYLNHVNEFEAFYGVNRDEIRNDKYENNEKSPFTDIKAYYEMWVGMSFLDFVRDEGMHGGKSTIQKLIHALDGAYTIAALFELNAMRTSIQALLETLKHQTDSVLIRMQAADTMLQHDKAFWSDVLEKCKTYFKDEQLYTEDVVAALRDNAAMAVQIIARAEESNVTNARDQIKLAKRIIDHGHTLKRGDSTTEDRDNAVKWMTYHCKRDSVLCNCLIPDVLQTILEVMKKSIEVRGSGGSSVAAESVRPVSVQQAWRWLCVNGHRDVTKLHPQHFGTILSGSRATHLTTLLSDLKKSSEI